MELYIDNNDEMKIISMGLLRASVEYLKVTKEQFIKTIYPKENMDNAIIEGMVNHKGAKTTKEEFIDHIIYLFDNI